MSVTNVFFDFGMPGWSVEYSHNSGDWTNLKLHRNGKYRKRIFHIGWNPKEKRFAKNADSKLLEDNFPGMLEKVRTYLEDSYEL